jgi:hypothetical protein
MAVKRQTLHQKVVSVTRVYLGPTADRFVDRQIINHLHKKPDELSQKDLLSLIDWIQAVVSLITDDGEIIEEYISELRKLTVPPKKRKGKK